MPELPEVETTKQSLSPLLGKTVTTITYSGHRLREPIPDLSALIGTRFVGVIRRAKYLLLEFKKYPDTETLSLLVHLGMSGSLGQYPNLKKRKHDHLIIGFGDLCLHYHDPRRFGIIAWAKDSVRYLKKLGVEPLSDDFDGAYLYQKIRHSRRPIKSVIMEQAVVVGVGNIYAAESLFLAGIHPQTPANALDKETLEQLCHHIKAVLIRAINLGGSTLRDFQVGGGQTGYFQQTLLVYGREGKPCVQCQTPLQNQKIGGRASVFCPTCQAML